MYTSAINKTGAGSLGKANSHFTRLQHTDCTEVLYNQNETEVPGNKRSPGLRMNHGDRDAFESLLFCTNDSFQNRHLTYSQAFPRIPIKVELENDINGCLHYLFVLGTYM